MTWENKHKNQVTHKMIHKNIDSTFVRIECKLSYIYIYKVKFSNNWNEVTCKLCLKKKEKK